MEQKENSDHLYNMTFGYGKNNFMKRTKSANFLQNANSRGICVKRSKSLLKIPRFFQNLENRNSKSNISLEPPTPEFDKIPELKSINIKSIIHKPIRLIKKPQFLIKSSITQPKIITKFNPKILKTQRMSNQIKKTSLQNFINVSAIRSSSMKKSKSSISINQSYRRSAKTNRMNSSELPEILAIGRKMPKNMSRAFYNSKLPDAFKRIQTESKPFRKITN